MYFFNDIFTLFEKKSSEYSYFTENINLLHVDVQYGTRIRRNFPQIQLMIQNNSQSVTKQAWEKENLPN